MTETDASGNLLQTRRFPLLREDACSGQRNAALSDALTAAVNWVKETREPVAAEYLEFTAKKKAMAQFMVAASAPSLSRGDRLPCESKLCEQICALESKRPSKDFWARWPDARRVPAKGSMATASCDGPDFVPLAVTPTAKRSND